MRQPRGGGGGQNGPQTAGILKKTGQIHAYIAPEPPGRGPRLRRSHKLSHIQGQCNAPFCTLYTRARAALSSALLDAGTDQSSTWFRRHRRLGGHCGAGSAFLSGQAGAILADSLSLFLTAAESTFSTPAWIAPGWQPARPHHQYCRAALSRGPSGRPGSRSRGSLLPAGSCCVGCPEQHFSVPTTSRVTTACAALLEANDYLPQPL